MADTMSESIGALRLDSERLCCQCMASASHWPAACLGVTLYIHIVACCLSLVCRHCEQTAMRHAKGYVLATCHACGHLVCHLWGSSLHDKDEAHAHTSTAAN